MKKLKVLSIILAILLITVGCGKEEQEKSSENVSKEYLSSDDIKLTMIKPKTINPILNKDKSVSYIMNLVYDGLFTIDEDYNAQPQLVKEYGISGDGKSINIILKDAKWHDDTPVTSGDVAFTIDFIQKNENSPYNPLIENISSISVKSDDEFTINLKEVDPFTVDTLIFPIVSKEQLYGTSENESLNYSKNMIGSGPYKIEKYEERDGMILSKNDNYHTKLNDISKEIKVSIVPDNEAQVSMVMALRSDIASISLNDLSKFYEEQFKIIKYEGRDYESLIFNYDNPYLKDINFRKAIVSAINKEQILEEGYTSNATPINFPLNSNSKYYDKELKPFVYDKEKAQNYIQKVNPILDGEIENKNSDKKEEQKDIKSKIANLNLKIVVDKSNAESVKVAYIISDNLKQVGIKSTVKELLGEELNKAIDSKEYDMALVSYKLSSVPDSTKIIEKSGYTSEKLTNYINSLLASTNEPQTKDIYKSIQKHINDNVAFISLVITDEYLVKNQRIVGDISPNDFDIYDDFLNLDIKK